MPDTKDLGRLFAYRALLRKDAKRIQTAPTQEIDPPFRRATSLVLRVWGQHGVIVGWWRDSGMDETEALTAATQIPGHSSLTSREITPTTDEQGEMVSFLGLSELEKAQARKAVAKHTGNLDEEWATLAMLGLDQ